MTSDVPFSRQVRELHETYCRLTHQQLTLNWQREETWTLWLRYRREFPFTDRDLNAVVLHLQAEIRAGNRNPGCLKFHNLIGNPDWFEEDLELSRHRKPPDTDRTRVLRSTGRAPAPADQPPRTAEQILASKEFREFVELKKQLKP